MEREATPCNSNRSTKQRRYAYTKVKDARKHPVRGLWQRNGRFFARITVEDDAGRKAMKWVPLDSTTSAEAQTEFRRVRVERDDNRLRHIGRSPRLSDYLTETYLPRLRLSGKKPDTIVTEKGHLDHWVRSIGHLELAKIRPHHLTAHLHKIKDAGRSSRTRNLALVCLRSLLKAAQTDGFLKNLPIDGIKWERVDKAKRTLFTLAEINRLCTSALGIRATKDGEATPVTKNGQQFSDYLKFLALTGAREQEALKVRWQDVNFEQRVLTIGWNADTKNREARHVDINPDLNAHLREMHSRRQPDSEWIFPSPQRGHADKHAKTFRESLLLVREAAGMPSFGFHDCRHHFISYAVMSGIDFMTIAKWVGHKDGGVLIGKVYGHLSNEHAQAQAAKLTFLPQVVAEPKAFVA